MIKKLKVINYLGEVLDLELGYPEKSGFLIQDIRGLTPADADINVTELANSDGAVFNSSRISTRNVVLTLRFLENPTIEHTRHQSYRFFPTKKPITLLIETDTRTCFVMGYVEKNDPTIFSKKTGTQVSIVCPDPYLYSINGQSTLFTSSIPVLEFPFFNDSLTEKLSEIGQVANVTVNTVLYEGDSEVGMTLTINATGVAEDVTIFNVNTGESMSIDTSKISLVSDPPLVEHIQNGDEIVISTVKGNKFMTLLRNGSYYNILNTLDRSSNWLRLVRGDNVLAYSAVSGILNLQFKIENQIIYEGI